MSQETTPAFSPLDRAEYARQARLLLALHSARPVLLDGRQQFLHTVRAQLAGGRIEMEVYVTGNAAVIDSTDITLPDPQVKDEK